MKQVLKNAVNERDSVEFQNRKGIDLRNTEKIIRFGSGSVPVYRGDWKPAPKQPYRKTYALKPGQSWFDIKRSGNQIETYAIDKLGRAVPVDAMVAKKLKSNGVTDVAFVELWTGVVLVDENLVCISPTTSHNPVIVHDCQRPCRERRRSIFPSK